MNVGSALITMPREQAQEKLRAYRRQLHKDSETLYREAEVGYQELAAGRPLIQLSKAIQQGGFDEKMRPRLAIARADRREVYFSWRASGTRGTFSSMKDPSWTSRRTPSLVIDVSLGRQHDKLHSVTGWALVPMVPADKRPDKGQLQDWHILWEVDQWHDRSQTLTASRDPYLLKHIGGDLWAVLAEWDLTQLEMAILEARPRT